MYTQNLIIFSWVDFLGRFLDRPIWLSHTISTPVLMICAKLKDARASHSVLAQQLNPNTLICKPCHNDISKYLADPHHPPRWKKDTSLNVVIWQSIIVPNSLKKDKEVLPKCDKCYT